MPVTFCVPLPPHNALDAASLGHMQHLWGPGVPSPPPPPVRGYACSPTVPCYPILRSCVVQAAPLSILHKLSAMFGFAKGQRLHPDTGVSRSCQLGDNCGFQNCR